MSTKADELLEDYKAVIQLTKTQMKALVILTFIGAIAAGSKGGYDGAKGLFAWLIGEPNIKDFARWYPVTIGLYSLYVWFSYWQRITLRKQVLESFASGSANDALAYRVYDDLDGNYCVKHSFLWGKACRTIPKVFLFAAPIISAVMMAVGLQRWKPGLAKEIFSSGEHIWIGGFVFCAMVFAAIFVMRIDAVSRADAEKTFKKCGRQA